MAIPYLPDNAPFSTVQRSWLNGFFAGIFGLQGAAPVNSVARTGASSNGNGASSNGASTAVAEPEDTGRKPHRGPGDSGRDPVGALASLRYRS